MFLHDSFTAVTKRVGMECIWHKAVPHLLQGQEETDVFVVREFHMCGCLL